jgi:hypothetical protein
MGIVPKEWCARHKQRTALNTVLKKLIGSYELRTSVYKSLALFPVLSQNKSALHTPNPFYLNTF